MKPENIKLRGSTCRSRAVGSRTINARHDGGRSSLNSARCSAGPAIPGQYQEEPLASARPATIPLHGRYQQPCLLFAALFALSGCSLWKTAAPSPPPSAPEPGLHYLVEFKADEDINRDASGRAMPVLLNLLELRSGGSFESADYFDLRDAAQVRLGQDLLRSDQLMIWPGTTEQRSYPASAEPPLLGVVAGYQQLEGRTWRVLIPFQKPARPTLYQRTLGHFRDEEERDIRIEVSIRQDGLHVQPLAQD